MEDALLHVMEKAALQAGRGLKRDLGEILHLQQSPKGLEEFVRATDKRAKEKICENLLEARPSFGFLTEEDGGEGEIKGSDPHHRWILDPLSGGVNFLHGFPFFAISLALEHRGELLAGLVYNPATDEMFRAMRGRGAFCNAKRIRVSSHTTLKESLIATGALAEAHKDSYDRLTEETHGRIRHTGSAALNLAYIAAGIFDGFIGESLQRRDLAAGIVLLREAGGLACDMRGKNDMLSTGDIIAANSNLLVPLQKIFSQSAASP